MYKGAKGPYEIHIKQERYPLDPRLARDNFGTMVCFHPRHSLGDQHTFASEDDFFADLLAEALGDWERAEAMQHRLMNRYDPQETGWKEYDRLINEALLKVIQRQYIMLPLYLLDHSGLAMSTTSFTAPLDSGRVGWIYVSREDVLKEYDGKAVSPARREKALVLLESEVEEYDHYLRGDCYRFALYRGENQLMACGGFLGELDSVKPGIEAMLPENAKGITENLYDPEDRASILGYLQAGNVRAPVSHVLRAYEQPAR